MAERKTGSGGVRCVITTPESTVLDTRAQSVSLPLFDGQRGVASGHAPFIGRLGAGEVRIRGEEGGSADAVRRAFIDGGFVEVGQDVVTIITQRSIPAEKLDAAAARADLEQMRREPARGAEAIDARMRSEAAARALLRAAERRG
ncbi:MAG: FoF1 ATP synthase subunit delta/epsilon [Planctomycetota bacterium]